jgi:hypothetical protein
MKLGETGMATSHFSWLTRENHVAANFGETYCKGFSTRRHLCSRTRQADHDPIFLEKSISFQFDCLIFSPQIYETVEMLQAEMVVAWSSIYDQELERILALLLQDVPGHKDEDAQNHPVNQEGGCLSGVCRE